MKENLIELIQGYFEYLDCKSCRLNDTHCEACKVCKINRTQWEISDEYAEQIADDINDITGLSLW